MLIEGEWLHAQGSQVNVALPPVMNRVVDDVKEQIAEGSLIFAEGNHIPCGALQHS
jgi:hypothetical protein